MSSSRSLLVQSLARCVSILLLFVLLTSPSMIWSDSLQTRSEDIIQRLQNILIFSQQLEVELETSQTISTQRQRLIDEQLIELIELKAELESWKTLSQQRARQIIELLNLIDELETRLNGLSALCAARVQPLEDALDVAKNDLRKRSRQRVLFALVGFVLGYVTRGLIK